MIDTEFRAAVIAARKPKTLTVGSKQRLVYDVSNIPGAAKLPRALIVLLENVVRRAQTDELAVEASHKVVSAGLAGENGAEIEYMPARVLFQDFTGVPVFVDFAAMRDAMVAAGGDPKKVNPHIPCTLVIDHSVTADCAGASDACTKNEAIEAERNAERFRFLKWASQSFSNVRIVPPGEGICHQLNIEQFCSIATTDALSQEEHEVACFDTLVGTDSHTTTANGLGVLSWGVGGIEAEAAALGQPISMRVPQVIGLRMTGALRDGVSGMDLALRVAQILRAEGVVGCFVEAYGQGVASLSATQRACVANMTPEYGATCTLFPCDDVALDYLALTGRDTEEITFTREYLMAEGIYNDAKERRYAKVVELNLNEVVPSLAGPSRPHDRVDVADLKQHFRVAALAHNHGDFDTRFAVDVPGESRELGHGAIAIAAVTSCTTATDPAMMVAAGLLAKRAADAGLKPKPWVKTILAPGSHATELLLKRAGLLDGLAELGFYTCGFGCMSCIGNSGPVLPWVNPLASEVELTSVLSGNRNFDGRISPDVSQNYLCQPALVVALSIAGTVDIDLESEPLGASSTGEPVYLADIMPTNAEIDAVLSRVLTTSVFEEGSAGLFEGSDAWHSIEVVGSDTYAWDEASTYIRRPPYFEIARKSTLFSLTDARPLVFAGDFVTTDHISPAGAIAADSPAAHYLQEHGVAPADFNSYGSRRGNHEVMERGTFANVKFQNKLADGRLGCWTRDFIDGELKSVWDASQDYAAHGVELCVVAGKMYGSGSSRDWAGKGPLLQGVRMVIAESLERIHRSNLVGMGILPLEFADGQNAESLGLTGQETFSLGPIDFSAGLPASPTCEVVARSQDGGETRFTCTIRVDTPTEGAYLAAGGILPYVLTQLQNAH